MNTTNFSLVEPKFMNESRRKFSLRLLRFLYFFLMFSLGIFMALGFAKLISHTETVKNPVANMPYLLVWLNDASPLYLSLTLAGTLGAILHTILIHGQLDLPSWSDNDTGVKLGFLGEIFIGISGAFIAYVFVPTVYLDSGIKAFVTGLVGGYGGQLILNALLKKQLELIARADLAEKDAKQANAEKEQIAEGKDLLVLVNRQIQNGLTETELLDLQKKIPKANLEDRELIFYRASDARRAAQRSKSSTFRLRIQRSVPILKSLVESDNSSPDYHAQLAFAYVDSEPPLLAEAISNLDSAIEIRGSSIREDSWKYELYRAIARIKLTRQVGENANKAAQGREEILRDLVAVDHNKGLAQTLREYESDGVDIPVKDWLTQNQEWLRQQNESKDLLNSIFPSLLMQAALLPQQSSTNDSSQKSGTVTTRVTSLIAPATENPRNVSPKSTQFFAEATNTVPLQAINLIKEFEGCELSAYPDPKTNGEPWTIGWGTTVYPDGKIVGRNDSITQVQADEYLAINLENNFWNILQKKIPYWVNMHDDMRSALCSFAYNLGAYFYGDDADFHTITACLKDKRWHDVPKALKLYVNPGSNVEEGLSRRRRAEGALWQQGLSKLEDTSPKPIQENVIDTADLNRDIKLNVQYYSQLDSTTPHSQRMCFSSSCAMALKYLRPEALSGENADDTYLATVLEYGDTTIPAAQVEALKNYGITAHFRQDLSFKDLDEQLAQGLPIAVGWNHHGSVDSPTGGHWCLVVGRKADGNAYYFMDPYGEADVVNGGYTFNKDGRYIIYSKKNWGPRWEVEGKGTGWGVIFKKLQ